MYILAILFFLTAIIYASVGFGGGSTYTALLVLFEVDYRLIPVISLVCNLVVVSAGSVYFFKHKLINRPLITALLAFSVPMSFIGGNLNISERNFILILGSALLISSLLMLLQKEISEKEMISSPQTLNYWKTGSLLGLPIGLIAGITGIGGGIFLAPILHLLKIAKAKTIAATACLFIMANSIAGLAGQLTKQGLAIIQTDALQAFLLLPIVVLVGGVIGNRLAIKFFTPQQLRRMTALLVLFVAIRLLLRWFAN